MTSILKTIKTADEKELVEKRVTLEEFSEALERQRFLGSTEMDHSNVGKWRDNV